MDGAHRAVACDAPAMRHRLSPGPSTLHGVFSRDLPPVLTVDSGDTVEVAVPDAGWHEFAMERPLRWAAMRKVAADPGPGAGHCLIGPVQVRGAKPGMTLEVAIEEVVPTSWGWGAGGGWDSPLNSALGLGEGAGNLRVMWEVDVARGVATNDFGDGVRLRPFPGVVGMPPPAPGNHSTVPPRQWGGNLDCRELVAGARLFLPIPVEGGLISFGDGHGAQGDGELSGIAIECGLERLVVTLTLHEGLRLSQPRAETPVGRITFGVAPTLDRAAVIATDGMLEWMGELWGLSRPRALLLASMAVDLRVTQAVNGVVGVHAVLAEDRLEAVG